MSADESDIPKTCPDCGGAWVGFEYRGVYDAAGRGQWNECLSFDGELRRAGVRSGAPSGPSVGVVGMSYEDWTPCPICGGGPRRASTAGGDRR